MKQETLAGFKSEDGKIELICSNTTALGDLHDFLLRIKGEIVQRMVKAQKEEEEAAEAHANDSETKKEE